MPHLMKHKGYTEKDLGMIASSFSFAYGINKLVCGVVADHVSPKWLFCTGLLFSGILVILFPFCHSSYMCAVLWAIAALFQGSGWPAASKLLKAWVPNRLGIAWSVISSSGNLAATCSPFIIAYITSTVSWDSNYYIIGGVSCFLTLILLFELKDKPPESVEKVGGEGSSSMRLIDILYIKSIWTVSLIYFILYMVKYAITDWGQLYFMQYLDVPEIKAATSVGLIQFGGIFGNIIWGYISDKTIKIVPERSKVSRAPALMLSCTGLMVCVILFATTLDKSSSQVWIDMVCFSTGLMLDGAVALIGLTAMSCVPDHLASTAHGFTCAFSQVGSFLAGYPFSIIVSSYGWYAAYQTVSVCSLAMLLANFYLTYLSFQTIKVKSN